MHTGSVLDGRVTETLSFGMFASEEERKIPPTEKNASHKVKWDLLCASYWQQLLSLSDTHGIILPWFWNGQHDVARYGSLFAVTFLSVPPSIS